MKNSKPFILSKNYRFSDNLCFDSAEHESPESFHAETFSLWESGKARQVPSGARRAQSPTRILPSAKQAGQAQRSAPHKILCKSSLRYFLHLCRDVPQGIFSAPKGHSPCGGAASSLMRTGGIIGPGSPEPGRI